MPDEGGDVGPCRVVLDTLKVDELAGLMSRAYILRPSQFLPPRQKLILQALR